MPHKKIKNILKSRKSLIDLARKATRAQLKKRKRPASNIVKQELFRDNLKKLKKGTFDPKSVRIRKRVIPKSFL